MTGHGMELEVQGGQCQWEDTRLWDLHVVCVHAIVLRVLPCPAVTFEQFCCKM